MPDSPHPEPIVAVVIPALNEAGKIGRVLDKLPRDGRFEAIVVDDGSTDGTGDESRSRGAGAVSGHQVWGGIGTATRAGWKAGLARNRSHAAVPHEHAPA